MLGLRCLDEVHQQELFECLEDREEHLDLTLRRSGSGLSMLDMPASEEPTVMEELVEERVVLEPHHLNQYFHF